MGLESATYISGLNSSNPTSGDNASQGDDHLRLIKATLLATFPSVTGAVTATHTQLNTTTTPRLPVADPDWTGVMSNTANSQPSFRVNSSSFETAASTNFDTYAENYDQGSSFNATTGVFTVPSAGVYIFSLCWTSSLSGNGQASVEIYSAAALQLAYGEYTNTTATGYIKHGTVVAIARLAAADTVVARTGGMTSATAQAISFSGHKLC